MKKKMMVIAAIVICLSILAAGTLAYFTDEALVHNVITSGGIDIELVEMTDQDVPFEDVSGVMPGAEVSKIVTVKNTGPSEAWVRVKVEKAIELAEGVAGEVDLSLIVLDIDEENWTEQDGYYYYNAALKPGQSTEPLFTTVTYDTDMGNLYQNSVATLDVSAQAVQVANNGDSALTAAGWPAA